MPPAKKVTKAKSSPTKKVEVVNPAAEFNEWKNRTTQKLDDTLKAQNSSGDNAPSTLRFVSDTLLRNEFRSAKWTP